MRTALLAVPVRVVRLIGRDTGFATPVAFTSGQVPGALGLGQLAAAAELPEVPVRPSYPARLPARRPGPAAAAPRPATRRARASSPASAATSGKIAATRGQAGRVLLIF